MTDQPILFRKVLGTLRPVTPAAEALMAALPDRAVRVEITGIRGNTRRLALYFCMLKAATELLSDAVDGILSVPVLDDWLRREYGLSKPVVSKKTGEIIGYDRGRIAFDKLNEGERSAFITWAIEKLSARLGCDASELRREGEARLGERAA